MHLALLLMLAAWQELQTKPAAPAFGNNFKNFPSKLTIPAGSARLKVEPRAAPGNCAIPLLNALKEDTSQSNMPVLKPRGEFKMPIVAPVPVCEGFGR